MLLLTPYIVIYVLIAILGASIITYPHIIAAFSKSERQRRPKQTTLYPTRCTTTSPMLDQNRELVTAFILQFDSKDS